MAESAKSLRDRVRRRAADSCEYCRLPQAAERLHTFQLEHVIPKKHDGRTVFSNLAWACQSCNLHKGTDLTGIDPESGAVVLLFNPRVDQWDVHFAMDENGEIEGKSAVGRASVKVLAMNSSGRAFLRAMFR